MYSPAGVAGSVREKPQPTAAAAVAAVAAAAVAAAAGAATAAAVNPAGVDSSWVRIAQPDHKRLERIHLHGRSRRVKGIIAHLLPESVVLRLGVAAYARFTQL